jgi:hypothetical protein
MTNPKTTDSNDSNIPVGRNSGLSLVQAITFLNHGLMVQAHATSELSKLCVSLAGDFAPDHVRTIASSAGMEWAGFEDLLNVGRDRKHICHVLAAELVEAERLAASMKNDNPSR